MAHISHTPHFSHPILQHGIHAVTQLDTDKPTITAAITIITQHFNISSHIP